MAVFVAPFSPGLGWLEDSSAAQPVPAGGTRQAGRRARRPDSDLIYSGINPTYRHWLQQRDLDWHSPNWERNSTFIFYIYI